MNSLFRFSKSASTERYFNALVGEHHDQLYWLIRKWVSVHDDAEDVLQNTWMKIYKGLPGFKGDSKISTWMYRIAYHESLRFLKKTKTNYRLDDIDSDYLNRLKADTYFDVNQAHLVLHQALGKLKEKERFLFTLKQEKEMTFKEMGAILGMNENSIKTIYYKAEKKVKNHLQINIDHETV